MVARIRCGCIEEEQKPSDRTGGDGGTAEEPRPTSRIGRASSRVVVLVGVAGPAIAHLDLDPACR